MSTQLVVAEIQRFLASDKPEVLCIKGKWGVGKTFAWRRYLGEAQAKKVFNSKSYSYASLFGLNSLDDLRYAIFEGKVSSEKVLTGPDLDTVRALLEKGESWGRKGRNLIGPVASFFGAGDLGDAIAKSAFLLVRDQLVCLDDLERAGEGLKQRDVLGLASFLKEQRRCKVVLLLNEEAMAPGEKAEFERLLEKVVDVSLLFEPGPADAAAIAIEGSGTVPDRLRHGTITLGITNIRVIKKIERLAKRLEELLSPFRTEVLEQAVVTCTLGGWAVFEPDHAPTMAFVRDYNTVLLAMRDDRANAEEVVKWRDRFTALPYGMADDFDRVVFDGVQAGYFDEEQLLKQAGTLEETIKFSNRENSFSKAWDRYHHSLAVDDAEVLDGLVQGARDNLTDISATNMNATVRLLRQFGYGAQADALISDYVATVPDERALLDLGNNHFMSDDPIDPVFENAFRVRLGGLVDDRDHAGVLLGVAKGGWNDADEALISKMTPADFERVIMAATGPDVRRIVQAGMAIGRSESDAGKAVNVSLTTALTKIAALSPLRERRLRGWGFPPPPRPDL